MSIYLSDREKAAIAAIDESELDELIDAAMARESSTPLSKLRVSDGGTYLASKFRSFEKALGEYRKSKSKKKRERTYSDAITAGNRLSSAVSQMKRRLGDEEKDRQLFIIDDHIFWPSHFSKEMQVGVSYKWRNSTSEKWEHGSIIFHHEVNTRPNYNPPQPKRKPSKAKQAEELQNELSQTWEHLKQAALYSIRDYFRDGGDGESIPDSFRAIPDKHTLALNNFSLQFWRESP